MTDDMNSFSLGEIEKVRVPETTDLDVLFKYCVDRGRLAGLLFKGTTIAFWQTGAGLARVQVLHEQVNQGKKRKDRIQFGKFLDRYSEETGYSQTWCYDSIKVFRYFPTASDAADYAVKQATRIASGDNRLMSIGYLPTDEKPPLAHKPTTDAHKPTTEAISDLPEPSTTTPDLEPTLAQQPTHIVDDLGDDDEPEFESTLAERLGLLAQEIEHVFQSATKFTADGVLKNRGRIDLAQLEKAKKDLNDLVKILKKLPA